MAQDNFSQRELPSTLHKEDLIKKGELARKDLVGIISDPRFTMHFDVPYRPDHTSNAVDRLGWYYLDTELPVHSHHKGTGVVLFRTDAKTDRDATAVYIPRAGGVLRHSRFCRTEVETLANTVAARVMGSTILVSVTGAKTLDQSYNLGDIVLPDDLMDQTRVPIQPVSGSHFSVTPRMTPPYSQEVRNALKKVASYKEFTDIVKEGGVHTSIPGSNYPSEAELKRYASDGATFLGTNAVYHEVVQAMKFGMHPDVVLLITEDSNGNRLEGKALAQAQETLTRYINAFVKKTKKYGRGNRLAAQLTTLPQIEGEIKLGESERTGDFEWINHDYLRAAASSMARQYRLLKK